MRAGICKQALLQVHLNQFVTTSFVPRRRAKKEGIFGPAGTAPAIHMGGKFCKKMAGQSAFLGG
jgi:hypothetical protein